MIRISISDTTMMANAWDGNENLFEREFPTAVPVPCKRRGSNVYDVDLETARAILRSVEGCPAAQGDMFGGDPSCGEPAAVRATIKQIRRKIAKEVE